MWQGFPIRPDQASTIARGVDHLYYFLTAVDLFFTFVIFLTIFYFAVRYRRRSKHEKPAQVETYLPLEILWTAVPLALCAVMFVFSSRIYVENSPPPRAASEIFGIGTQWMVMLQPPEAPSDIR